jgi:superfamily II DNA or RNA helicase
VTRPNASLQRALNDEFSEKVRVHGAEYHEADRVRLEHVDSDRVRAHVKGGADYEVALEWRRGKTAGDVVFGCSCPDFSKFGPCKHLWAVVLAVEEDERGPWSQKEPSQRSRLEDLRSMVAGRPRDAWGRVTEVGVQIRYVIEVGDSLRAHRLALTTERVRRLKTGWGQARPYRLGARNAQPLTDPLDRRIFALLSGARQDFESPVTASHGASSDFALEPDLALELLPTLCATGRLHWRDSKRLGGALAWDAGPPWALMAGVSRNGEELELELRLEREGERMELDQPVFLFDWGVVCTDEKIGPFDPRGANELLAELRLRGPLRVPAADEGELIKTLMQFPAAADGTGLPPLEQIVPVPQLRIETPRDAHRREARLACTITFDYEGRRIDPEESVGAIALSKGRLAARDFEAEERALGQFLAAGGRNESDMWLGGHGVIARGKMPDLVRALLAQGWMVEAEGAQWRPAGSVSASVQSGIDWFDVEMGVTYGDQVASLPELLKAAREGSHTVRLGDGSVGVLPEHWLERWGPLALAGSVSGDKVRFESNQAWLLDALLAEREGVQTDAGFEHALERLAGFRGVEPVDEPEGFRGTLRAYQREGLGWLGFLSELGLGGCLADDMGLGKTVQVLAFLQARPRTKPSLVVAPRSVVFNWIDEAARFTPGLSVLDYSGAGRRHLRERFASTDIVVTTYGTLRRDATILKDVDFDCVVLDEAQAIKNAASQAAKAARLLRAEQRLALSGTPVENHLGELWSLFEFLNPGMLGRSTAFKRIGARAGQDSGNEHIDFLARALRPFFLRRNKDDVLDDLPPKTEQTIHCELGPSERRRYDELRAHYRKALLARADEEGLDRMKIHVLEALLRLRQASCHPALIDPACAAEGSAKLDTLLEHIAAVVEEGHKALVFSQFTKLLAVVRARLDEAGHTYEYLDGSTTKRKEVVTRFQTDPACPLFLISLKAGGHGLNLTAADYVFLLDPWWNPAVESQAIDRAHRIGRTRPVVAYRLIATDTVEEKVVDLQARKRELAAALFVGERGTLRDMTREDLELLLS